MKLSDFTYHLPPELIAQEPLPDRSSSRMLHLDGNSGKLADRNFPDILELIEPKDLLVFNDTRVIPARLFGQKETGGKVEVLVERILSSQRCLAHIRASKSPKPGSRLHLEYAFEVHVQGRQGSLFILELDQSGQLLELLEKHGHIPLPPYIERDDSSQDRERYQTIFADKPGAVAAPTAGLHFDNRVMQQLSARGVQTTAVTLHVGAGTFQPVKSEDLSQHVMHKEYVNVTEETCQQIRECQARGGRVIAVGTTTVRSLESAQQQGEIEPFTGETQLFITPGYRFGIVDAMLTNFHLPGSTLLMLVSAFSGYDNMLKAYEHAIEQKYRFFSYGDAMFLTRRTHDRVAREASTPSTL